MKTVKAPTSRSRAQGKKTLGAARNKSADATAKAPQAQPSGTPSRKSYDPSEIALIGHELGEMTSEIVKDDAELAERCSGVIRVVEADFVEEVIIQAVPRIEDNESPIPAVALIYAYGYEGHTYRLARPRIIVVKGEAQEYLPTSQEPSSSLTGPLRIWRMSKHDETISIEVESGELKTLVLDANQPGNRAVNSYSAHMQMSHRGGKLS